MNFLKKGPEIKLSEIKVPGFVEDVYYDLKDRHLLPVAVILLIALVAVPIAISSKNGSEGVPEGGLGASISQSEIGAATGALVAEAAPGLREYERRLNHNQATDPFKSKVEAPNEGGSTSGGGDAESSSASEEGSSVSSSSGESFDFPVTPESIPSPPESNSEGTTTKSKLTYYSMTIDVRITGGSGDEKKTTVRKNLPELTMLPSRETPAIVYMGSTKDGKKAVMTVSSDVQAIYGDAKCVLGSQTCQLLAMEKGLPETFVYGGNGKTYKIEITEIHLTESDKVNKAPLGEGKKKGKGKRSLSGLAAGASDFD